MVNKWIIHVASGQFIEGGSYDPVAPADPAFAVVDVPEGPRIEPQAERYDPTTVSKRRLATADEIRRAAAQQAGAKYVRLSASRDVSILCAMVVRSRDIPAWGKFTVPQKLAAIELEAKAWVEIRALVDSNFKE